MINKLAELREERAEGEKGFTLIELLVVVVIIGVLVAIAIPLYLNYRKGAQNRTAQSDVRNAVSAVESCIGDNAGKVPTGTATSSSTNNVINLTCNGGTGTATATTAAGGQQTINVSDGVVVVYTPTAATNTYEISGKFGSDGTLYTYKSATGKTS